MSNADIFSLGFEVDTGALGQGKAMAEAFAKALYDVQRAMQAEETAARKAGEAERKKAEETRRAEEAARRAADPHLRLADALGRIGQQAQGLSGQLGGLTTGFMGMGNALTSPQGLQGGLTAIGQRVMALTSGLGPLGVGLGIVTGGLLVMGGAVSGTLTGLARQQEAFMLMEARLKNVYGSASAARDMMGELAEMAQRNGIAFQAVADGFLRLARTNESIGLTKKEMLDLTNTVQMLGRVSNASQGEMQSGMMQFSQALAAGRLNGDELRSIMENMPALAEAIAKGLGVSVGQLRAMGAEGTLTADKISGALLGQLPEIQKQFDELPDTSEQAFARVGNSWDRLVGRMGEVLEASGIVAGFANAYAAVLDGAYDTITADTPEQRLAVLTRERRKALDSMAEESKNSNVEGFADRVNNTALLETQDEYIALRNRQRVLEAKDAAEGARVADQAALSRAIAVGTDVEKLLKQRKELETQIRTVEEGIKAAKRTPPGPEQAEAAARLAAQLAALQGQLASIKAPLADYLSATERLRANAEKFGVGGAASIADEAKSLFDAGLKAGGEGVMTMEQALAAVIDRRVASTQNATEAMEADIDAQKRMMDAIGQGTQAQIEAEVATKALAYQMQNFGATLDGPAADAMERYKENLRELLQIQRDTADAQRAYNAELQLGIEQQITAAIRAGATAGEIASLRRQLQLGVGLTGEGGNFPVTLLTTESGGRLDAYNSEVGSGGHVGHGGRLQFGQDRLTEAARAGVVPQMTPLEFSKQPLGVQATVENWHFADIDRQAAERGLMRYVGQNVGGVDITQNAIRAMAHLGGIGGAQSYLESGGMVNPADANGTTLRDYARIHGGSMTLGQQALGAEERLAAERAAQNAEQRIAQLEKEAEDLRRKAAAGTTSEAQRIERERLVREAGASAETPEDRVALENAMRAKLEAQDNAAVAERLRAIEDETELMKEQARIAKLPAREREIELRVLEAVNAEKARGNELDEAAIAAIRARITEQIAEKDFRDAATEQADRFKEVWTTAAQGIGSALENAMSQALNNGKIEAEDILKGLVADITMAIFRAYVTKPLVDGLTSLIGAQGFVSDAAGTRMGYAHGGVLAFAGGGVVNSPTLFPMARGAGLMGEAGPEAVLPLKRGADGKLGVGAGGGGGGTTVVVNDMRQAPGAEPVEVQETEGPDGQRMLSIMVRDEVRKQVRNGELDKEMRSSFGVTRQLTRR